MKLKTSSLLICILLGGLVVGCGDAAPRRSTDGADADAIREYEEAVAAMEQQSAESGMEDEANATTK
jgi:hypothetical protein